MTMEERIRYNAQRRERYAKLSDVQRAVIIQAAIERQRVKRAKMTKKENESYKKKHAAYERNRRAKMTEEEYYAYKKGRAAYQQWRYYKLKQQILKHNH